MPANFCLKTTKKAKCFHLAEFWQADVHSSPEASTKVGWAGEDVAKTFIPHELPASLLNQVLHLSNSEMNKNKLQWTTLITQ